MAVTADKVIVELEAKLDRYNANVANAEQKFTRSMDGIQKSAGRTEQFVSRSMGALSGAFAAVSVVALARTFLTIADSAKKMESQLRLATASFGSFSTSQKDSQRIAQETRSGLEETTTLYANFLRASKEVGKSQGEASRATETFAKALKIGGAGAAEAASATLQFGQALASGALRGDEFNSIAEASPRILKLLADAVGVPIGQLRAMAAEGKLTSEILFDALTNTKFTAGIDAEFKQMPVTFDEAMQQVTNAATITFGAFDKGGEFSTALANFVTQGGDGFSDLAKSAENFGIEVRSIFAGLGGVWDEFRSLGEAAFDAISKTPGISNIIARVQQLNDLLAKTPLNPIGFIGNQIGGNGSFQNARQAESDRLRRAQVGREIDAKFDRFDPFFNLKQGAGGTGGGSPRASASAKPARLKTPKGKTVTTLEEWLNETAIEVSNDVLKQANQIRNDGGFAVDSERALDDAVDQARKNIDERQELERQANEENFRIQQNQMLALADTFESAFQGGTKAVWQNFKDIGIRILAELAAKFAISQLSGGQGGGGGFNFGSALASSAKAAFGFSGGGSGVIGGRGGTDTNTLSLNGKPFANVTRGETLAIGNKALAGRGSMGGSGDVYVDARGAVMNDEFAAMILATSKGYTDTRSAEAGQAAYKQSIKDAPAAVSRRRRFG